MYIIKNPPFKEGFLLSYLKRYEQSPMKLLCLIMILLSSYLASAQKSFVKQFRDIVNDTANGFSGFRGAEQEISKGGSNQMKTFVSTLQLENTSGNRVLYTGDTTSATFAYVACIADSVGESEGKMICDIWMDKISALMGGSFSMKKYETENGFSGTYGWKYQREKLGLSIDMDPVGNTALKKVSLMISYFINHKLR
jgi:hypothetical protein